MEIHTWLEDPSVGARRDPRQAPLQWHAAQARECLAAARDYWHSLAGLLDLYWHEGPDALVRELTGGYPYDSDQDDLVSALARLEEHIDALQAGIRQIDEAEGPSEPRRAGGGLESREGHASAEVAEAWGAVFEGLPEPFHLVLAYNNAITNDPCHLCGARTDPCGLDVFIAAHPPTELVCDGCAARMAPALLVARETAMHQETRQTALARIIRVWGATPAEQQAIRDRVAQLWSLYDD
jgi:hypothetical protein